jgi:hypothetical protein
LNCIWRREMTLRENVYSQPELVSHIRTDETGLAVTDAWASLAFRLGCVSERELS